MTGPEHYAEAERLTKLTNQRGLPGGPVRMEAVALAQVHATLALAAAQAEPVAQKWDGEDSPGAREMAKAWTEAIS